MIPFRLLIPVQGHLKMNKKKRSCLQAKLIDTCYFNDVLTHFGVEASLAFVSLCFYYKYIAIHFQLKLEIAQQNRHNLSTQCSNQLDLHS